MFDRVVNTHLVVNTPTVYLPVKLAFGLKLKIIVGFILISLNNQSPKSFTDFSEKVYLHLFSNGHNHKC